MIRILFGTIVFLVAASPWFFMLAFGGLPGGNTEQAEELDLANQSLLVARQEARMSEERVKELEEDMEAQSSKMQFLEEGIVKAETSRDAALNDVEMLNQQMKDLRSQLTDIENRLLEETNRANTMETMNEDIAARLDSSIQEVRRLQTIIRTLSQD